MPSLEKALLGIFVISEGNPKGELCFGKVNTNGVSPLKGGTLINEIETDFLVFRVNQRLLYFVFIAIPYDKLTS